MIRVCPHSDSKCVHGMRCPYTCATDSYDGNKNLMAEQNAGAPNPPGEGEVPVAWQALTEIADRPLIKEPKQGDYGKDRERCPSCGHAWHVDEEPHHAPTCDRMVAVAARREMALASRPTPATPEGLREKVEAEEVERVIRDLEVPNPFYNGTVMEGAVTGSHAPARRAAVNLIRRLAALQPQAQPAAISPETDR